MKNALFLVGTGETAESFWWPYLRKELMAMGYKVSIPKFPVTDEAVRDVNLPIAMKSAEFNEDTVLIGHSSGCALILSLLERINIKIKQIVLVAGFATAIPTNKPPRLLQESYDWEKIKKNINDVVIINAANDPWEANDKQGQYMFEKLGGMLIINNEGHMGSGIFNQPYKEFPLLIKLVDGENWGK